MSQRIRPQLTQHVYPSLHYFARMTFPQPPVRPEAAGPVSWQGYSYRRFAGVDHDLNADLADLAATQLGSCSFGFRIDRRRRSAGVAAIVAFITGTALAAVFPTEGAGQQIAVEGRVYDAYRNESGVQNALITLGDLGSVFSNPDGTFAFRGVEPGEYEIQVQAPGYLSLERLVDLRRDTTLMLALSPAPIALDSIDVVLGRLDFDGRVRDPRTNSWVYLAEVRSDQGHRENTNIFGRFDLDDVFDGPPISIVILGFGHLPLDTTFVPDDDQRYTFDVAPDPVMGRMLNAYRKRLDDRIAGKTYDFQPILNKNDIADFEANTSLRRILMDRYPLHIVDRIGCLFVDEREYMIRGEEERASVLDGTVASEIERIELLAFSGPGWLLMARVYTQPFFRRHIGTGDDLDAPSMTLTPAGMLCR